MSQESELKVFLLRIFLTILLARDSDVLRINISSSDSIVSFIKIVPFELQQEYAMSENYRGCNRYTT